MVINEDEGGKGHITPYTEFNRRMELEDWKTRISDRLGKMSQGWPGKVVGEGKGMLVLLLCAPGDYMEGLRGQFL